MTGKRTNPAIIMLGTDIIIALTIILILMGVGIAKYSEFRKVVVISAGAIEAAGILKVDISTYYALKGEWPKDKDALLELFPEKKEWYEKIEPDKGYYDLKTYSHSIVKGTINVNINKLQGNNTVTLRPAVPAEDPLGPVKWVAGAQGKLKGWMVTGEDHTTVDDRYISDELK